MTATRRRAVVIASWSAAALSLVAVFIAYRDPALTVDLANRVWACF